jgi:hypothetical protein
VSTGCARPPFSTMKIGAMKKFLIGCALVILVAVAAVFLMP